MTSYYISVLPHFTPPHEVLPVAPDRPPEPLLLQEDLRPPGRPVPELANPWPPGVVASPTLRQDEGGELQRLPS